MLIKVGCNQCGQAVAALIDWGGGRVMMDAACLHTQLHITNRRNKRLNLSRS